MTAMNYELFKALKDVGCSEEQAQKAAEGWTEKGEIVTKAELQAELANSKQTKLAYRWNDCCGCYHSNEFLWIEKPERSRTPFNMSSHSECANALAPSSPVI